MFVRIPDFGRTGVIQDTVGEALTTGAWTDALNMRFTGVELQKMLEPTIFVQWDEDTNGQPIWMQLWADGISTYLAVATASALWFYSNDGVSTPEWVNASRPEGYNTDGYWDSFAWGDTCIFNNGIDAPQIFNQNTAKFEDLPNWGMISTADDILNNNPASKKVQASCVRLVPYKSFLVAVGVTESGLYQPNKVWWSDSTNLAGYDGAPNWDYETPASLSGQIVVDPEGGAIRTAANLNEQLIIYTDGGATAMQVVGGTLVMSFRRLFKRGAAGLHSVFEVQNQHFVVNQDSIYLHDGSTVVGNLIAKDRVEEEFFKRIGKGGRFGTGDVLWSSLQVVKNPDRKEVIISYTDPGQAEPPVPACVIPYFITQPYEVDAPQPTCKVYECDAYTNSIQSLFPSNNWYWPGSEGVIGGAGGTIPGFDANTPDLTNLQSGVNTATPSLTDECATTSKLAVGVTNALGVRNDTAIPFVNVLQPDGETQLGRITMSGITQHNTGSAGNGLGYISIGSESPGNFGEIYIRADNDKIYFTNGGGNLSPSSAYAEISLADMGVSRPDLFWWMLDWSWVVENRDAGEDGIGVAHSRNVVTATIYAATKESGLFSSTYGPEPYRSGDVSPTKGLTPDPADDFHDYQFGGPDDKMIWNHYTCGGLDNDAIVSDVADELYDAFLRNFTTYVDPDPTCIQPAPTCKVYECDAVAQAFVEFDSDVWYMFSGYADDAPALVGGDGEVPNMATNSVMDSTAVARNVERNDQAVPSWDGCNQPDLTKYNGNNTGAGSNINHARNSTVSPNYVGAFDANTQGAILLPSYASDSGNANAHHEVGCFEFLTFIYQGYSVGWNPVTGSVRWWCGNDQDNDERATITLPADPDFVGYDPNNPDTTTNRIWRNLVWKLIRTENGITITFWKDGVKDGPYEQTENAAGTPLANVDWWDLDDGSSGRDPRAAKWGGGNADSSRYKPWWLLYVWCAPYEFSEENIGKLQVAFEQNKSTYVDPNPDCIPPVPDPTITELARGGLTFNGFGYDNLVMTNPNTGDIVWNHRGYGPIKKSTDGGTTFADLQLRQQNSGEILVHMDYDEGTGRTWYFPYYDTQRLIRSEYSDNFSASANVVWNATNTPFDNGLPNSYTHGPKIINGRMWHLNAESTNSASATIIRHNDLGNVGADIEDPAGYDDWPGVPNEAVPISSGDLSSWGTLPVSNGKMFITYSGQGQSIDYGMIVDQETLVQDVDLGVITKVTGDNQGYVSAGDGTEARVLIQIDNVNGIQTFARINGTTTGAPFTEVVYNFGRQTTQKPRIGYGGGRWLVVAFDAADPSILLCMGDGITGVQELQLPVSSPTIGCIPSYFGMNLVVGGCLPIPLMTMLTERCSCSRWSFTNGYIYI